MSYRVDIPTLSANEVYTLTFEYEGTETIQLIVGDLTLETTDRRVVFTTTSPVNYIESNVNLTNLNMYEGYYEGDDFGGEYTQESYIEGRSLVNLKNKDSYYLANNWYQLMEMTEDGYKRVTQVPNDRDISCFYLGGDSNEFAKNLTGEKYTVILDVRKNTFPSDVVFEFCMCYSEAGSYEKLDDDIYAGEYGMYKKILGGENGRAEAVVYKTQVQTQQLPGRYWGTLINVTTQDGLSLTNTLQGRTDLDNCVIEYKVTVIEGDYYGQGIQPFSGIGCVKSPKILSETKHRNIMLNTKPSVTTNLITVSDDNTYIYLAETARYSELKFEFTQEYLAQYGISNGDKLCIELDGMLIEGTGTQAANTSTRIGTTGCTWTDGNQGYKSLPENGHYCNYITIASNASTISISFLNNMDWSGTNKIYEIQNLRVYKIEDISEVGTYDCCKISTPDDLELYKVNDTIYDKLDLTTGTLYKNTGTYVLDETFVDRTSNWEVSIHDTTGNVTFTSRQHKYLRDEHNFPGGLYNNAIISNADPASNIVNNNNIEITRPRLYFDVYSNNNYTVIIMPASYNVTTLEELRTWLQNNPMIFNYKLGTPYTEQLSLNALKSYRNGSITTSSQQLAPTLKTTLPVSNKFTQTNLSSGQTYNIYFDGTATKLDAGGTIITDPVSPCEVECGGTTLTIEGTDIQNVRVLETTNKNEVGSVCGTTDVELNRVITSDLEVITNDIEFSSVGTDNGNINTVDNKLGTINTKGGHTWGAGYFTSNKTYPKGFSLLHIEFDVDMPSNNLMAIINFNNNVSHTYYNFRDLTLDNDTATIAQGQTSGTGVRYSSIVTKGHFSRLVYCFSSQGKINLNINTGSSAMLTASGNSAEGSTSGYTACANNGGVTISNFKIKVIENYPDATVSSQITSSLRTDNGLTVIWQDMDMSIGQSISDLEQPIKLRSLGTTYDSYNPVTGELTKRIGVSETDGSYSVLSSPIVSKIYNHETITNLLLMDELTLNGTTYGIPIANKPTTITLIALNKTVDKCPRVSLYSSSTNAWVSNVNLKFDGDRVYYTAPTGQYIGSIVFYGNGASDIYAYSSIDQFLEQKIVCIGEIYENQIFEYFEGTMENKINLPILHLYTNGQVKVYSDSKIYPTTILNGQSTNNYEVNELNRYNNYTIRYEGECESINLANKSNEQGTNRIVKTSTDGRGNLTFVNNSGDINNVLLVEHDVREQEINHFNGLQTVEVNQLFISSKQNLFEAYMKNDFEFLNNVYNNAQAYGSLHNGVFKCGNLSAGNNLQWAWNLIRPHVSNCDYVGRESKEDNPIVLANKVYNISFNISIVDHHDVDKNHNYIIRAYDFDGKMVSVQKATGGQAYLEINSNGVTNPTPTKFINLDVIFSKDIYCFALHANYGGQWAFDCTITDFTICEPENAKPDVPLVYEYIDLPQPVQLNRIHKENMPYGAWSNVLGQHVNLADGIAYDSYNPITGEYIQRVYKMTLNGDDGIKYIDNWSGVQYAISDSTLPYPRKARYGDTVGRYAGLIDVYGVPYGASYNAQNDIFVTWLNNNAIVLNLPRKYTNNVFNQNACKQWLRENPITLYYELETPITTQLTPIEIPTFEGGTLQLITTDGKVFPMIEYSMPTNNRYDTSSWETGAVYTQRNMTEAYFNESTTPMIPTETTTLTTDHISSGSIILNDNGNGLIVLKGNYTGRDIPYFTGMRSVEAIEVETTPSPDQPLFGKGGRK